MLPNPEAFEQFAEMVRDTSRAQNDQIAALGEEIAALRGGTGNPHSPNLAVLESKMDRLLAEVVPLVSQDHDDLIRLEARLTNWKIISGITQAISTAVGAMFGLVDRA